MSSDTSTQPQQSTDAQDIDNRLFKYTRPSSINCDYCRKDITTLIHIKCAECSDVELCLECFAYGVEVSPHVKTHSYRVISNVTKPLFENDWGADEELLLLDGILQYGFGNWNDIADTIQNGKNKQRCEQHYNECYIYTDNDMLPDIDHCICDGYEYKKNIVPSSYAELAYKKQLQNNSSTQMQNNLATQIKQQTIDKVQDNNEQKINNDNNDDNKLQQANTNITTTTDSTATTSSSSHVTTGGKTLHHTSSEKQPSAQAFVAAGFAVPNINTGVNTDNNNTTNNTTATTTTTTTPSNKRRNTKGQNQYTKQKDRNNSTNNKDSNSGNTTTGGVVGSSSVRPPKQRGKGLLVGWQDKREDFDTEYENSAELIIADMEFYDNEPERDKLIKLDVLNIYNQILDERAERKKFILERGLLDRRERKRNKLEREVYINMRPFARFHSQQQHETLVQGIVKEKQLRDRIQQLQHYRCMGIQTLAEAELYELERKKRETAVNMKQQARMFDSGSNSALSTTLRRNTLSSKRHSNVNDSINNNTSTLEEAANAMKSQNQQDTIDDSNTTQQQTSQDTYDCSSMENADKLSSKEIELCNMLHLQPNHYIQIKDKLLTEIYNRELHKQGNGNQLLRIEINKQDKLCDFIIQSGLLNTSEHFKIQNKPYDLNIRDDKGNLLQDNDNDMKTD